MKRIGTYLICAALSFTFLSTASAVSTFGAFTRGSDLEPVSAFLEDGGEGSASASVNFTTFRAEAGFDPSSTYLPVLKAESTGLDATFDDDRTQARAQAYQVFTSSSVIKMDISSIQIPMSLSRWICLGVFSLTDKGSSRTYL